MQNLLMLACGRKPVLLVYKVKGISSICFLLDVFYFLMLFNRLRTEKSPFASLTRAQQIGISQLYLSQFCLLKDHEICLSIFF